MIAAGNRLAAILPTRQRCDLAFRTYPRSSSSVRSSII